MRRQPFLLPPVKEVRRVGRVDDVDVVDGRLIFLVDALEYPLRTRPFDFDVDAGVLGSKSLGDGLGDLDVDRGVPSDFAFLGRRGEHRRRGLLRIRDRNNRGERSHGAAKGLQRSIHISSPAVVFGSKEPV